MRFALSLVPLLFVASVHAETVDAYKLRTYGQETAPLVYIFTSPSCPHCAAYHQDILPALKQLAASGQAQLKLVDSGYNTRSVQVAQIARCMSNAQYDSFMQNVYTHQGDWGFEVRYQDTLNRYAKQAGQPEAAFQKCLFSSDLAGTITEQRDRLSEQFGVRAYPTTVVITRSGPQMFKGADPRIIPEIEEALRP